MTSQLDRDLLMRDCRKLQWLAQYKCRRCLDSGIIYHRNGMEEPCDYCDAFNKKIEAGVNNDRKLTETANKSVA